MIDIRDIKNLLEQISEQKANYSIAVAMGVQPSKVSKLKKEAGKLGLLKKEGRQWVLSNLGELFLTERYNHQFSLLHRSLVDTLANNGYVTIEVKTMQVALTVWNLSKEAKYSTVSINDVVKTTNLSRKDVLVVGKKLEALGCYNLTQIADLDNFTLSNTQPISRIVEKISNKYDVV